AAAGPPTDVTVVVPANSAISFPELHVAMANGYFTAEGLKVTIQPVVGTGSVIQALSAGRGAVGIVGVARYLAAAEKMPNLVGFYLSLQEGIFSLVVKDSSKYRTPSDL